MSDKPEIVEDVPEELLDEQEKEQKKKKDDEAGEEVDEDEDEVEDEEEEEDEGDYGDEDEDEDHPLQILAECIEEIYKQEKRCASKRVSNLGFELSNNVYPLIRSALEAIGGYLAELDEEQDEIAQQQEAFIAAVSDTRKVAEKLIEIFEDEDTNVDKKFEDDISMLLSWADKFLKETENIPVGDE